MEMAQVDTVSPAKTNGAASAVSKADSETAKARPSLTADSARSSHAENFSQIAAVMMRDRNFRNTRLGELEWLLLPPLLAGQWRLGKVSASVPNADPKAGVTLVPAAMALWARVSPAVDERLAKDLDKPLLLKPNEWTSGDILWLIAVAGDPRAMPRFLVSLRDREFKDKTVKLRAGGPDKKPVVMNLEEYTRDLKV
jgi:cytolysin-activating lysine-acyltransferase